MILNDDYFSKLSELYTLEVTVIEVLFIALRHIESDTLRSSIADMRAKHLGLRDEIAAFLTARDLPRMEPAELSLLLIHSEVIFASLFDAPLIFSIIADHEARLHTAYDHLKNCRKSSSFIRKIIIDGWINTRENREYIEAFLPKKIAGYS
ncbi:hypothetical protein [Legionella taurinensis]|uniref:DUF892 family protein n=1 Tax=Legionella taurinensis TaxID=70611 RepID=A0A3A5L165_9GAMM|nr:hypothetical protein [Legionella taurinensis]RJT43946.1 hypothetical protein D6J04_13145 [Legionella taurinensis]RJT64969.1 hypothetical protein D6J03_13460 [Legionella taurinensis]STY27194.1 Uncharacterised protein [Legionella taurinensis]